MANFLITDGDRHVRKGGSDTTGDGTAGNPYATINKVMTIAGSSKIVVGDGEYNENVLPTQQLSAYGLYGDGTVAFVGSGSGTGYVNKSNSHLMKIHNFIITGYALGVGTGGNKCPRGVIGCYLHGNDQNFDMDSGYNDVAFEYNIIDGTAAVTPSELLVCKPVVRNLTVIGDHIKLDRQYVAGNIPPKFRVTNCYFDTASTVEILDTATFDGFYCCNFRGEIIYNATTYASLSAFAAVYPELAINCIDSDPLFNDPTNGDYTCSSSSPHLTSSTDGTFIGACGYAAFSDVDVTDSSSGVNISGGAATLTGSPTGTITFTFRDLGKDYELGVPKLIGTDDYAGDNVVDSDLTNTQPNHRTIEIKWATESEGSGALSGKSWKHYVLNMPITEDDSGNGNGDSAFTASEGMPVVARYVQIKATLRDNGSKS